MAATIHHAFSSLSAIGTRRTKSRTSPDSRRLGGARPVRCQVAVGENRRVRVRNGDDSIEICRVLNGMWQTSGGWGRIDRDDAVEAMLRYADAGLSTFDMADHLGCVCIFLMLGVTLSYRLTETRVL
ncbi:hypothetical protein RHMOL_Rhmol13G0138600 [Rhododendron molle]|uniref:Uncharacterized protein n=1 Tax=Rhododendron molle TaxID=49168 RepID=A0ACC0L6Y0_RHOML|nr:hypothetical protein RHMOL_Rhmol13G0138600 [Rhododendron molle]